MIEMERHLKPVKEISLIPLINVIFLLLIYFMVVGAVERFDILDVNPPLAESSEELDQGTLVIILGRNDEVVVNDDWVAFNEIEPKVKEFLAHNKDRIITVKADAKLEAQKLVRLIELIRKTGAKHITIATQVM
jgi:biopolymer transport protein ExbD